MDALAHADVFDRNIKLGLDGNGDTAFGCSIQFGIPVKYIGVGESIDDLQKFDADEFVNALFDVKDSEEEE